MEILAFNLYAKGGVHVEGKLLSAVFTDFTPVSNGTVRLRFTETSRDARHETSTEIERLGSLRSFGCRFNFVHLDILDDDFMDRSVIQLSPSLSPSLSP